MCTFKKIVTNTKWGMGFLKKKIHNTGTGTLKTVLSLARD